jgi:hypothetical protein
MIYGIPAAILHRSVVVSTRLPWAVSCHGGSVGVEEPRNAWGERWTTMGYSTEDYLLAQREEGGSQLCDALKAPAE